MKKTIAIALLALMALPSFILAQGTPPKTQGTQQPPATQPAGQKPLAAKMTYDVFPTTGQDAPQQSKDESECYGWAVQNSGSDPFQLQKQAQQQQQQTQKEKEQAQATAGEGAGVKGAFK